MAWRKKAMSLGVKLQKGKLGYNTCLGIHWQRHKVTSAGWRVHHLEGKQGRSAPTGSRSGSQCQQQQQLGGIGPLHGSLPAAAVKVQGVGRDGQVGQQQRGLVQQRQAQAGVQGGGARQQAQRGVAAQQDGQGERAAALVVSQVADVVEQVLRVGRAGEA